MKRAFAFLALSAACGLSFAQMSPVGLWRSIDDETGQPKAEIRIVESNGALLGRIERSLRKEGTQRPTCEACTDDRKGRPMIGLDIVRGGTQAEGKDVWEGGKILDPENGKEYRARFSPIDGGKKLEVRGYLGPFWRTQTWERVQ
ncbi:MAG: DUF2147 domain-containing protein [Gammaproteobacteria bacterium]|nr:DUF2147 domain-containing protein [Gammaproteobacteria bacterium]MBU1440407.1 DUF2147 domain-containing protein [Gammaproteobacteria bacterium]MBU2289095.1 DUF2147 domain-containing protein [Gammaproteobacteria bacterium]MBU2407780.1 DUF2147 domain-containing protein [Gammaproteobacteria bacterium]